MIPAKVVTGTAATAQAFHASADAALTATARPATAAQVSTSPSTAPGTGVAAAAAMGETPHPATQAAITEDTGAAATAAAGIVLHEVSGAVLELKQALFCQLKGMTLQLECLRKCDAILAVKCSEQARAAAALKTFSQVWWGPLM